MYIYMGHMGYEQTKPYEDHFWKKNNIDLLFDHVESIEPNGKKLKLRSQGELDYDKLLIATGSNSNLFGWPGQDLDGVQGLYSLQDLQQMEHHTKDIERAVIVGGGLIGVEMAEMLHSRHIPVTYLIRERGFASHFLPADEANMVARHIRSRGIDLREEVDLKEILADENGRAKAVVTATGEEIGCQFVGLTVGVHPNIDLAKDAGVETDKGILVSSNLETNIKDIYASGDCVQIQDPPAGRKATEAVWYVGRIQGKTVAYNICGKAVDYDPGVWFNSAKFFDIEYQVYGDIKPQLGEGEQTLYWEHPDGERSIRITYNANNEVIGFNLMGIRYRHDVCDEWISKGTNIESVLENLGKANFETEFHGQYEKELVSIYNHQNPGKNISLKKRRGLFALLK